MESLDLVSEPRRRGGVSRQARGEEGLPEVEPGCRHTLCGLRGLLGRLTLEVHGHSLQTNRLLIFKCMFKFELNILLPALDSPKASHCTKNTSRTSLQRLQDPS